jgi:ribonucleoside-diphosphate reductase alpha chain
MGKLVSIKINKETKPLYDIEVEDNHNFVVNDGIVIKNSEQYLSRESLCVLASLNAGKFSANDEECKKELEKIGQSINRFLDNVNEAELRNGTYATPHQKLAIEKLRRTGAGFTNMCAWLFKKNLEYGTEDGNKAVANFMKWYNYNLYKSSIELGKEKGNFDLFDQDKFEQSPFVKRMMKLGLEFKTMRNCTASSLAPTGTLTTQFRDTALSYGIEPAFYIYWWKRTRMGGKYEYYFCVPTVVREVFAQKGCPIPMTSDTIKDTWDGKIGRPIAEFIEANKSKIGVKFRSATEIHPMEKLDLMEQVMKWVDSSISVTYMLPENSDWKMVYDFILAAHEKEVKSIAAFPDKKMYGIVSFVPFQDLAKKLIQEGVTIHEQNFSKEELDELYGKVYLPPDEYKIQKTKAPVRPKELSCDIHHTKVTKKLDKVRTFDYIVLVGIMPPNDPYEIFVAENGVLDKKYKTGVIAKKARGVYSLLVDGQVVLDDICKDATESEDVLTRMVSCGLRHGADIQFVVQQLEKSKGDLFAFSKAICRVLKKYVPDHTKVVGETCKQCGGTDLIRLEGCATCTKCNYSKCS